MPIIEKANQQNVLSDREADDAIAFIRDHHHRQQQIKDPQQVLSNIFIVNGFPLVNDCSIILPSISPGLYKFGSMHPIIPGNSYTRVKTST